MWYILYALIGICSAWIIRYWGFPIFLTCCNGCIKKVLSDELEKIDAEQDRVYNRLTNPKVLVDEETGELYFDGQISPSKRKEFDEDNEDTFDDISSIDDERKSECDIENDRKSSVRSALSERKLSFQVVNETIKPKSKPTTFTRNPFKLARIARAKAEREAFQEKIKATVKIPTKDERISTGVHNFKSKFIYDVEADVGWYLTRDQYLCMAKETKDNLYRMPTSSFFHKVSRRNKQKEKPAYQQEWDTATSVDGNSWKLKRKHAKLWRLKTVIDMMDNPPSVIHKTENRRKKKTDDNNIITFQHSLSLNDLKKKDDERSSQSESGHSDNLL